MLYSHGSDTCALTSGVPYMKGTSHAVFKILLLLGVIYLKGSLHER